jgi:tRNA nucleotidyltransferase (CCA-adding enzyme)
MKIEIPAGVRRVMEELISRGYEAYIVGGCVRDALRGAAPNDWDIATNATPDEMSSVFSDYTLVPTGEKYGTKTVVIGENHYEVTTYREDGNYSDGRRPDNVTFSRSLNDDLSRRDLTINAMAYNDDAGMIDPFGGARDLKQGVVRCVGNARDRLNEDALRVMRAIRFAVTLDFDLPKETVEAIWDCGENLKNVSQERKRDELVKILRGIRGLNKESAHFFTLRRMTEYIIKRIMPEFRQMAQVTHNNPFHYTDVFNHTMDMLFAADTDDVEILLTVLFHDIGKIKCRVFDERRLTNHYYGHAEHSVSVSREIMERLRFDNKTIERVLLLVTGHDFELQNNRRSAKKLLERFGLELCQKLYQFQLLDKAAHRWNYPGYYQEWVSEASKAVALWEEILENREAFRVGDLAINGHDLIAIGYRQGIGIGEALRLCLEYVVEHPDKNTKGDLIEYVKNLAEN